MDRDFLYNSLEEARQNTFEKIAAPKMLSGKVPGRLSRGISSAVEGIKNFGRKATQDHQVKGMLHGASEGAIGGGLVGGISSVNPGSIATAQTRARTEKTKDPGKRFLKGVGYGAAAGTLVGGLAGGLAGHRFAKPYLTFHEDKKGLLINEVRPDLKRVGLDAGDIGAVSGGIAGVGGSVYGAYKSNKPKEKTAASVSALAAGAKRLGGITKAPAKQMVGGIAQVGGGLTTNTIPNVQKLTKGMYGNLYHDLNIGPQIESTFGGMPKNMQGKIFMPKGGPYNALKEPLDLPQLSGEGQKAFNVATNLHEGFERAVTPSTAANYGVGHMSPKVLLNEHNMMTTMSGPGADEARKAYQSMRAMTGEDALMGSTLEQAYGPRMANFQYGAGDKIPKAMKKDLINKHRQGMRTQLSQMVEENPDLLKTAAPIFSAGSLAGTMAGVGAAAGGIKGFYGSNRFDKDVSLDRRVVNAGLGGLAGAAIGGGLGYGAGKHLIKKFPGMGKPIESLAALPTDEGAVKALKMVGRGAHAAYMNPAVRGILGYKATKGLHDWYREGVDKYRISQLAGERMKKQNPGFDDGDELGFLMAERGYGDYSKRSGGK